MGKNQKCLSHSTLVIQMPSNFEEFLSEFMRTRAISHSLEMLSANKQWIKELIVCSGTEDQKRADYSSWLLTHFAISFPEILDQEATPLFENVQRTAFDGTRRNLLKTLTFLPLRVNETSHMFDFCLTIIADPKQKVAAQVYALQYLGTICQAYPELKNETLIIVNEQVGKYSRAMEYTIKKFILSNKSSQNNN